MRGRFKITNTYLSFITDKDLFDCIDELYTGYKRALDSRDLTVFMRNRIDPIKFVFDATVLDAPIKEYVQREVMRQSDKSISNYIGDFHENLLGKIDGFHKRGIGESIDIQSDDGKIIAEVKNKHNTVKGEDQAGIFNKLKRHLDDPEDNAEKAYYVRIIDSKSRNNIWSFTSRGTLYENENIYIISGDKFYELLTGDPNAFADLCSVLPLALRDYVNSLPKENVIEQTDSTIVEEVESYYPIHTKEDDSIDDLEFLNRLFKVNFYEKSDYKSFEHFSITDKS